MTAEDMLMIKEKKGYTVAQLSEYSGVPAGTIVKILNGETRKARRATMDALERVLLDESGLMQGKADKYRKASELLLTDSGDYVSTGPVAGDYGYKLDEGKLLFLHSTEAAYIYEDGKGKYTAEDYFALPAGSRKELIDGYMFDRNMPTTNHQRIVGELFLQLSSQIKKNGGTCDAFSGNVDVVLDEKTVVVPDVFIVCDRDKDKGTHIEGAPDFVIEVLSPSNSQYDMIKKHSKYGEAGVREYWVVNIEKRKVIAYDFENRDVSIAAFEGEMPLAIYDGRISINLDELAKVVR